MRTENDFESLPRDTFMEAALIRQEGDITALSFTNCTAEASRWRELKFLMMAARSASLGFPAALAPVVGHPNKTAAAISTDKLGRQDK
jgi:hypothetical protein